MTNNITIIDQVVQGDKRVGYAEVDITGLDAAGTENLAAADIVPNVGSPDVVIVAGQESESYRVTYDPVNDQFDVVSVSDGTDVTSGTDVGVVTVRVEGDR